MKQILALLTLATLSVSGIDAAAYRVREGKIISEQQEKENSVQDYFAKATDAYGKKDWAELIKYAQVVVKNFPTTPFSQEATFYLGVGYFHQKDFELSNKFFSVYLKKQTTPRHFEEAIRYKFEIAEGFKNGAKKHVMGWETMPKWIPAKDDAVAIYDEVITALPHHDLGARALYGKAKLLVLSEDFKGGIETYQTLIRRFPKHALSLESYIGIGEIYLKQCQVEYPDPDFLDLAQINLRKFRAEFPGESRVSEGEKMLLEMKEIYASSLYETGQFFERTKKPNASLIYYSKVLTNYGDTKVAVRAKERLDALKPEKNTAKKEEPKKEEPKAVAAPAPKPVKVEEKVVQVPETKVEPVQQPIVEEKAVQTPVLEEKLVQVPETKTEPVSSPVSEEKIVEAPVTSQAVEQPVIEEKVVQKEAQQSLPATIEEDKKVAEVEEKPANEVSSSEEGDNIVPSSSDVMPQADDQQAAETIRKWPVPIDAPDQLMGYAQ